MILSLCLLLPALSPSSQEICSAPGVLPAPTLYLSHMSTQVGGSVQLQCSVFSRVPVTRIVFCKDGEEILSQFGSEEKVTYDYDHVVSGDSAGNYACGYEIKDGYNRMNRSQLSSAQCLSLTGSASSSGGGEELTRPGPVMSPAIWAARCFLVLLLLVSAPVITFVLEKWDLSESAGLEETCGGSSSIMWGRTLFSSCEQWREGSFLGRYQCPALSECWGDTVDQCCTIDPCDNCLCPDNCCSLLQSLLPSPARDTGSHSAPQSADFCSLPAMPGSHQALSDLSPAMNYPSQGQTAQPSSFLLYK